MEDMWDECRKFGEVKRVEIPRPAEGARGVGKVLGGGGLVPFWLGHCLWPR